MNIANRQLGALPKEIASRLRALRQRITRWVLVKGLARWILLVLAIFVIDMFIDRVFKLDFAQRLIMLVLMGGLVAGLFFWRVLRPLAGRISDDALLHEIELKHPELNENLISGAQLAREQDLKSRGVSMELADATIQRSKELARKMDFQGTIDQQKFAKNMALLIGGLLLSVGLVFGVYQTNFLRTWFNRNILLTDAQWPQATYLQIVGADNGQLVLPRGTDHRLLVQVTKESRRKDVTVTLEIDNPSGQAIHMMKPTGKLEGREHSFVIHNVSSELTLRARGGDDVTPTVKVKLVEPPTILELKMAAVLPRYTGMENQPLEGAGPHNVLAGSQIEGGIKVNKPLSSCKLLSDTSSLDLAIGKEDDTYLLRLPESGKPLVGGQYEFKLVDESGLASTRPTRMVINISDDGPPKTLASMLGISGLVVPRARIPVSYNALDDYGLAKLQFATAWKAEDAKENEVQQRDIPIVAFGLEPDQIVRQKQDIAVLELEPLEVTVGASFRLLIRATDTLPENPNSTDSAEFLLRVVSAEELRADLLRREIEQRKAFQRAYESQLEVMGELQALAAAQRLVESQEKFDTMRQDRIISLGRDQKLIGTTVSTIADRFEEYLVETQNNRLDEDQQVTGMRSFADRFDNNIIRPIRFLDGELIASASRNIDNCRRLLGDRSELSDAVGTTTEVQQQILEEMKKIMSEMEDSESFQEAVNKLLEINRDETQIRAEIQKRRTQQVDDLDEDDIFDDN